MKSNSENNADRAGKNGTGYQVNRRDFLKIAGVAAGTAASAYFLATFGLKIPSAELIRDGTLVKFQGTSSGKIFESLDHGESWVLAADFGEACAVRNMRSKTAGLFAEIEYDGFIFKLQSSDGREWYG